MATKIKNSVDLPYFTEVLLPALNEMDNADPYSKSRLIVAMGKAILSSIGSNRAFLETIYYQSAERALGLQNHEKDEAGFFIGFEESERATDPDGHVTKTIYDRLTDKQNELVSNGEHMEKVLFSVYDRLQDGWQLTTGEKGDLVKPDNKQKATGIRDIEGIVEDNKRFWLRYRVQGQEEQEQKHNKLQHDANKARFEERAKARAARMRPIR